MHVASAFPPVARQWHQEATLAAYSCGGSRGVEARASHRVPFSPAAAKRGDSGTVTQMDRSSAGSELSTRGALACAVRACLWRSGNGGDVGLPARAAPSRGQLCRAIGRDLPRTEGAAKSNDLRQPRENIDHLDPSLFGLGWIALVFRQTYQLHDKRMK